MKVFSLMCSVYEASKIPVIIKNEDKLWENDCFKKEFKFENCNDKSRFLENIFSKSGLNYELLGQNLYTVNILSYDDIFIAEVIRSDNITKFIKNERVRSYLKYVFNSLRLSVSKISAYADLIHHLDENKTDNPSKLSEYLSSIDKQLMEIVGNIIEPEQLVYLIDDGCQESTVCIQDELDMIIKDIADAGGNKIPVSLSCAGGIFARFNRPTFRIIIADMIEKLCLGEFIPDKITITSVRNRQNSADIYIGSDWSSHRKRSGYDTENNGDCLFFKYICDIFCAKYNAGIAFSSSENGSRYTISFPSIPCNSYGLSANTKHFNAGHFDIVNIKFGSAWQYEDRKD